MMALWRTRWVGTVVIVVTTLAGQACTSKAKSPTSPTIEVRWEAGEQAVSQAVGASWKSIHQVYDQATAPAAPAKAGWASPLGGTAAGVAAESTSDVACPNLTIQYFNAAGIEQASYHPATTTRITAKGVCTVDGVTAAVDLILDDVQASSPTLLANGTVQGTYKLIPVTAEIKNVRMPKQTCAYPLSGQIVARASDVVMTVEFNGTSTATATYTRAGSSSSFPIQLPAC